VAVLKEYQLAPQVTRERLYIDAVETVLSQSSKVLLDTAGGNSLMYLPLDKLIQQGGTTPSSSLPAVSPGGANQIPMRPEQRENSRGRSVR
jgi:membrane protease subunit HflK